MNVPGGLPPQRPDQLVQPISRAGTGPAPQTNVFSRIIVVTGGPGGIFIYSPVAGPGNLVGSWTANAGVDQYGNSYPAGINVTAGVLSNVVVNALSETMNPGPFILRGLTGINVVFFTSSGVNNWTAPAGVTTVQAYCWGPGGNGGSGAVGTEGGGGGGGGEFAFEGAVGVTPATVYHPTVGTPGSSTTFAGDSLTVTAHSGSNGTNGTASVPGPGGAGGTGSTNSSHFNGGAGGSAGSPAGHGSSGGGGGSGPSNTQAGNAGMAGGGSSGIGGAGGAAPTGFFGGGAGGTGGTHGTNAGVSAGTQPGGGGGGGGDSGTNSGSAGANGQVVLIYSTGALGTDIVMATAAGTDPVTGFAYGVGLTVHENSFGTSFLANGNNIAAGGSATQLNVLSSDFDVSTAGKGLRVAEGTNAKQGTATLTAGTVTVANTSVTANSRIFLTAQTTGAGPGALRVSARTAGTSFVITSSNAADTSLVAYEIFEPG